VLRACHRGKGIAEYHDQTGAPDMRTIDECDQDVRCDEKRHGALVAQRVDDVEGDARRQCLSLNFGFRPVAALQDQPSTPGERRNPAVQVPWTIVAYAA